MNNTHPGTDLIDVRNVIDRVEELRADLKGFEDPSGSEYDEEVEELAQLEALLKDLAGRGGDYQWEGAWYPVTLIADSYFEDYARQFAEDIGAVGRGMSWPLGHIDWEAAAEALQMDYTCIDYGGVDYWYR